MNSIDKKILFDRITQEIREEYNYLKNEAMVRRLERRVEEAERKVKILELQMKPKCMMNIPKP